MPEEREKVSVFNSGKTETSTVTNEDRKTRKARLARVLERGIVADRLIVNLPTNLYGEWVSDDPVSIARMEAMGFQIDKEFAPSRSLHSTGEKMGKVGDVVFMTCAREDKELIDEIRQEQYDRKHKRGKQREETESAAQIRKEGLSTFVESREHVARRSDIERVLTKEEG
jgi:hypothetical protein